MPLGLRLWNLFIICHERGLAFVRKASHKRAKALLGATKFNKSHGQPYLLPKQNGNTLFILQFYFCSILNLYHTRVLIESVIALKERKPQRVRSQLCQNSKQIQKICPLTASLLNNSHREPRANFGASSWLTFATKQCLLKAANLEFQISVWIWNPDWHPVIKRTSHSNPVITETSNSALISEGRRHDAWILADSNLLERLEQHAYSTNGQPLCLFGDQAYPLRIHLQVPFRQNGLTPEMEAFNASMSRVQESVKWNFGEVVRSFKALDFKNNLKLGLSSVGKMYFVSSLIQNAITCLYGNQTTKFL